MMVIFAYMIYKIVYLKNNRLAILNIGGERDTATRLYAVVIN